MVAGEGFRDMVREFTNLSPHPTILSQSLEDLKENAREKLKNHLERRERYELLGCHDSLSEGR